MRTNGIPNIATNPLLDMADYEPNNGPKDVPHTVETALADIDEGELEFERGETFTHQEIMQMVWNKIAKYAD